MRHVNLDPVSAVGQLLAGRFARFNGAVDKLRSRGHVELGRVAFERIATSRGNRASRNEEPRPGNVSALDGLFDSDVAVACAFGLEVAQRCESLLQRAPDGNG